MWHGWHKVVQCPSKLAAQAEEQYWSAGKEDKAQVSSPHCEQPGHEGEVSEQMCIAEYTCSKLFKTGESSQSLCTEESSIPKAKEMKGMQEDISEDVVDCKLEKPQPVIEVNKNVNKIISAKLGPELKEVSDSTAKCVSTSRKDCGPPLTDNEKKLTKDNTFPKSTKTGEFLEKETKGSSQNVDQQTNRMAKHCPFEPQGCTKPFLGSGMEEFEKPFQTFVDTQQHFPPALSFTSCDIESHQDTIKRPPTSSAFGQEKHNFYSSFSFSETLDLAGALPQLYPKTRNFTHVRRSSMPSNISTFVCGSLANLSLGDHISTDIRENRCHFVEYSGPFPSPSDAPPSKETAHHFPSKVDKDLVSATVIPSQKESHQQTCKEVVPESPQKWLPEKKGSPVKTTTILEKAVISGVKPDRLRIPLSSSKDRLLEFRLESGLPGDLKIQVIPEVEIEKDPSREASPIPPDNSFTFNVSESGVEAPSIPTSPKSSTKKPLEDAAKQTSIDRLSMTTVSNDSEAGCTNNKKTMSGGGINICDLEISQQEYAPQIVLSHTARLEKTTEVLIVVKTLREEISTDLAAKHPSSTVIIEPQLQVETKVDMDNKIKIAEEVMEEAEIPLGAKNEDEEMPITEKVRLSQSAYENQESKTEGKSDGNQDGCIPGPDTNTAPYIDQQQPTECVEGAHIQEDHGRTATPLESQPERKWQGSVPKDNQTGPEEDDGADATAGEEPQTSNTNIVDTDKGLTKLEGTYNLIYCLNNSHNCFILFSKKQCL